MLDITVEARLDRAGVPSAHTRLDDWVGYLNTLLRRHFGREFVRGHRSQGVYVAQFTSEDAARMAMGWCASDLSDVRIVSLGSGATLTGFFSGGRDE